ncbi:hypothetical protein SLS59_009801 [Nothophoma quercina]|uniref:Uncharacterized protein n=1 Tax=Nothophoma quercina TaxID=749835 RepID=A0ABR3QJW0_9PLEO
MSPRFPLRFKHQRVTKWPRNDTNPESIKSNDSHRSEKLDITQRLEKRLAEYASSGSILKRWSFEITSLLISLICLIWIVLIYVHESGRLLNNFPNALGTANVLGKIVSACLILPITEALGQLKWNWFHKSNAMWDFEIFDKATIGPWGLCYFLAEIQEVFVLVNATSAIAATTTYSTAFGKQFQNETEMAMDDPDLFLIVEKFSYGNGTEADRYNDGLRPDIPLAGVLGEALLTRTLPLTTVLTKEPLYGNGSINFKHLRNTIMDVLIVAASDGTADSVYSLETPLAHECVLSWCVKTLNSKYDWGRYIEDTVSVVYNTTPGQFPWTSEFVSTPEENYTNIFYTQDISIEIEEGDPFRSKFGTSNGTVSAILQGFADIFPSFTTTFENATSPPVLRYETWSTGPAWHRYLDYNPWLQSNIITHMEKLARAMTNQVRSSANKEMVPGNSYNKETWIFVSRQ